MLPLVIDFFTLTDPNIRAVVFGMLLITSSTALVGTFSLLRKEALIGDVMAHASLPGICLAFIITGHKNPIFLSLGAFISSWSAALLINYITQHSKISQDTALSFVLSTTFGFGLLLLTIIQHSSNAYQSGLHNFLLGKAASLVNDDLQHLLALSLLVVVTIWFLYKELKLITFDRAFAQASGLPVWHLEFLLSVLTTLTIVISLQAVGLILMASMLITPAAAARFWTQRLSVMLGLAVLFSGISGVWGAFVSYTLPTMPTGPWVVVASAIIAYTSFLFAPQQGFFARKMKQRRHRKKMLLENILKIFYEMETTHNGLLTPRTIQELYAHRPIAPSALAEGLSHLQKQQMATPIDAHRWRLTVLGNSQGQAISERHELWEFYLKEYLRLPHHCNVHEDAEAIEHILTPDLVKTLKTLMADTQKTKK